MESGPASAT